MGAVAIFIINRNRTFLGQSVPFRTNLVVKLLQADEMVLSVQVQNNTLPCLFFGSRMPTWPAVLASACPHLSFFVSDASTARRACRAAQAGVGAFRNQFVYKNTTLVSIRKAVVRMPPCVSLYKILFCVWVFVHESILFFAHPPFV